MKPVLVMLNLVVGEEAQGEEIMKRYLILSLVIALVVGFAGCSGDGDESDDTGGDAAGAAQEIAADASTAVEQTAEAVKTDDVKADDGSSGK